MPTHHLLHILQLQALIDKVDDNRSGELEFPEFVKLVSDFRRGSTNKLATFIQFSKLAFEIRRELEQLKATPTRFTTPEATRGNAWGWQLKLRGPEGTPYKGGVFSFDIRYEKVLFCFLNFGILARNNWS